MLTSEQGLLRFTVVLKVGRAGFGLLLNPPLWVNPLPAAYGSKQPTCRLMTAQQAVNRGHGVGVAVDVQPRSLLSPFEHKPCPCVSDLPVLFSLNKVTCVMKG